MMDFIRLTSAVDDKSNVYISMDEISYFSGNKYTGTKIYIRHKDDIRHKEAISIIWVKESPGEIYKALEEQENARFNSIFGDSDVRKNIDVAEREG